jgi:hypothetical protein
VAYILYLEHTIVTSGSYDDVSGKWKISACVSWQGDGGSDHFQFFRNPPDTFSRFQDAEVAGIEYSKNWVDKKLNKKTLQKV